MIDLDPVQVLNIFFNSAFNTVMIVRCSKKDLQNGKLPKKNGSLEFLHMTEPQAHRLVASYREVYGRDCVNFYSANEIV